MEPTRSRRRRGRHTAMGLAAVVALGALGAGARPVGAAAASCNPALAGRTTQVAPGTGLTVALTFDDDRKEWMPAILNILRRNNIRATFFVTGQYASEMPTIMQRAARDGQVLANHTWYHYYPSAANGYWSVPYLTSAITSTANLQQQTVGYRGCFFRPPGGFMNNVAAVTASQNMETVLWSVDTRDWTQPGYYSASAQNSIVSLATSLTSSSAGHPVVLMHGGKASHEAESAVSSFRGNTVQALQRVIDWYRSRGYRFVAMDGTSGLAPIHGFSGDALPDLLATTSGGDLRLYTGTGTGYVNPGATIGLGWTIFDRVFSPGDFNGDGYADVMARMPDGRLFLYTGTGAGHVNPGRQIGAGWSIYDQILGAGDFSGDGNSDVLARTPSGDLYLYRGNGVGGWSGGRVRIGTGWNAFNLVLSAGHFSGDGTMDVIARTPGGGLYLYKGNGIGGWGSGRIQIGAGWQTFAKVIGVRDLNNDGRADLVGVTPSGQFYLYPGNGSGGFAGPGQYKASGWLLDKVFAAN
ncbi:FG-GAP-like repeat-containing protein [Terrabacter sp. 2YAF2]|uniref:FG-GAP-like repeat-containing protein n=1 Tax=Terrabacter sp. 2YAF2 TaxID=3233026 RepID=UPI003F987F3C